MSCQPTADITFTCPQTEGKDHPASLGVTYGKHVEFPSRCWLLVVDYRYTSVATQITHDAGPDQKHIGITVFWEMKPSLLAEVLD